MDGRRRCRRMVSDERSCVRDHAIPRSERIRRRVSWSRPDSHRRPPRLRLSALLAELRPPSCRRSPGGATGNRTPIPAVRVQRSPVELSPRSQARRRPSPRRGSRGVGGRLAAGHEGIEPPLRVLEARLVTMTLLPMRTRGSRLSFEAVRSAPAPRTGIEPVSLHRQWSCDASRITRRVVSSIAVVSPAGVEPASSRLRRPAPLRSATRTDARPIGAAIAEPRARGSVRESHPPPLSHSQPSSLDE